MANESELNSQSRSPIGSDAGGIGHVADAASVGSDPQYKRSPIQTASADFDGRRPFRQHIPNVKKVSTMFC